MSLSTIERLAPSGRFAVQFVLSIAFAQQAHAATLDSIEATAEGRVAATFEQVRETLLDIEHLGDGFPTVGHWRVLEQVPGRVRVHARHPAPWPFRDRDYVVDYRWATLSEGTWMLEAKAVSEPANGAFVEPQSDVVRLDSLRSCWTVRAHADGTRVTYEAEAIPRGRLPRWLERQSTVRDTGRLLEALEVELQRRYGTER